ncbi:MAG: hypothetical protein WAW84_00015 [Candidatus Rickettsiella isopodorum]|jgi:hypothetical protein
MRKIVLLCALSFFTFTSINAYADVFVHGYNRAGGTYVKPHHRSDPDGNFNNNWSTKGNKNPYTGEFGTKSKKEYPDSFSSLK